MKKILIAAAAVATLTAAAGAASAQSYGFDRYDRPAGAGQHINNKQERIRDQIRRAERTGRLSTREARGLEYEMRSISAQERQFRATRGLDRRELAILDQRLARLERQVWAQARDGDRYGYGYGDRRR